MHPALAFEKLSKHVLPNIMVNTIYRVRGEVSRMLSTMMTWNSATILIQIAH
jgi:hypothetical protein